MVSAVKELNFDEFISGRLNITTENDTRRITP
jgi:hypothetical protein